MSLLKTRASLEEEARTKETKLKEEADTRKRRSTLHKLIDLLLERAGSTRATETDPHITPSKRHKVHRPETDLYM